MRALEEKTPQKQDAQDNCNCDDDDFDQAHNESLAVGRCSNLRPDAL
jgi:hypothetical protein